MVRKKMNKFNNPLSLARDVKWGNAVKKLNPYETIFIHILSFDLGHRGVR